MNDLREKYHGIIPAFWACYDEQGNVDTDRVKAMARYLLGKGVTGFYVNGSTGECIYLSVEERKKILAAVMEEAAGKATVICHVACNSTRDSMELAAHAESLGVDAIASIPPIYFKLPDRAIAQYWNDISSAAPHTDFVIYNVPQLAGTELSVPLLRTMLDNPNVIGVKNTSLPTQDIWKFKQEGIRIRGEGGFIVFNGPDEQYISGRLMGADAGIGGTYTLYPELMLKAEELLGKGDFDGALKVQSAVNEIIFLLASGTGNLYSLAKEVMRRRCGINAGEMRKPFPAYGEADIPVIEKATSMIDGAIQLFC